MRRRSAIVSIIRTAICVFAMLSSRLFAATIVDNGDPSEGFGTAILSQRDGINQVGDDFELTSSAVLDSIEWWGTGDGNDFAIRIFSIGADGPSATPLVDVDVGVLEGESEEFAGQDYLRYEATLPDIALEAGSYLLSIVEQSEDDRFFWAASCEDGCEGDSFRRPLDGDEWRVGNWAVSFRIFGQRPDGTPAKVPVGDLASALLLLGALLGASFVVDRRRRERLRLAGSRRLA
jgi:hypothetical protein